MTVNINLLPWREELKEKQKKEFFSMLGLGASVVIALMVCVHIYMGHQITAQNGNNDYLRQEIAILDQQLVEIQNLQKEKEELLARMKVIQQLQGSRPEIVRLFDAVVRTVPEGLYLTNLMRKGDTIIIDGKAESNTRVSTFMRNIEGSNQLSSPVLNLIEAENEEQNKKQSANNEVEEKLIDFHLQATQLITSPIETSKAKATDPVSTTPEQVSAQPAKVGNTSP